MGFLFLWLLTIIVSFGLEIANELKIHKDVADAGYKIVLNEMTELEENINSNLTKSAIISLLIPFFNIMQAFQNSIHYNDLKPFVLDQLRLMDVLEEMTELEKKEYLKNATGLNALIIQMKFEERLSNAASIKTQNGEIFYDYGDFFDDITILNAKGDASRLSIKEQKKIVVDNLGIAFEHESKEINDVNNALELFDDNEFLNFNDNSDDYQKEIVNISQEISIYDQKQELENLKNELLEEQKKLKESYIENELTLTKKIK